MRTVLWSSAALDEFKQQIDYIAADDAVAAQAVADRLRETCNKLGAALTGRPGRVYGLYEKSVSGAPYVIAYEVDPIGHPQTVAIVRIIHTSRDWPTGGWPS